MIREHTPLWLGGMQARSQNVAAGQDSWARDGSLQRHFQVQSHDRYLAAAYQPPIQLSRTWRTVLLLMTGQGRRATSDARASGRRHGIRNPYCRSDGAARLRDILRGGTRATHSCPV